MGPVETNPPSMRGQARLFSLDTLKLTPLKSPLAPNRGGSCTTLFRVFWDTKQSIKEETFKSLVGLFKQGQTTISHQCPLVIQLYDVYTSLFLCLVWNISTHTSHTIWCVSLHIPPDWGNTESLKQVLQSWKWLRKTREEGADETTEAMMCRSPLRRGDCWWFHWHIHCHRSLTGSRFHLTRDRIKFQMNVRQSSSEHPRQYPTGLKQPRFLSWGGRSVGAVCCHSFSETRREIKTKNKQELRVSTETRVRRIDVDNTEFRRNSGRRRTFHPVDNLLWRPLCYRLHSSSSSSSSGGDRWPGNGKRQTTCAWPPWSHSPPPFGAVCLCPPSKLSSPVMSRGGSNPHSSSAPGADFVLLSWTAGENDTQPHAHTKTKVNKKFSKLSSNSC